MKMKLFLIAVFFSFSGMSWAATGPKNKYPDTPVKVFQNDNDLNDSINRMRFLSDFTPSTITANSNDYDTGSYNVLRLATDVSTRTITGFSGGRRGRWFMAVDIGTNTVVIANESASSVARNRVITGSGGSLTLQSLDTVFFWYDDTSSRWRVMFVN